MRTRNKSIPIRVTEKELEEIDANAKKAKKNRKTVFIADGHNYPDALGGGSAAAVNEGVILFTNKNKVFTAAVRDILVGYIKDIDRDSKSA